MEFKYYLRLRGHGNRVEGLDQHFLLGECTEHVLRQMVKEALRRLEGPPIEIETIGKEEVFLDSNQGYLQYCFHPVLVHDGLMYQLTPLSVPKGSVIGASTIKPSDFS